MGEKNQTMNIFVIVCFVTVPNVTKIIESTTAVITVDYCHRFNYYLIIF